MTLRDRILIWAARRGHLALVKCSLKMGANLHVDNDEAMAVAARAGHLKVVRHLGDMAIDEFSRMFNLEIVGPVTQDVPENTGPLSDEVHAEICRIISVCYAMRRLLIRQGGYDG